LAARSSSTQPSEAARSSSTPPWLAARSSWEQLWLAALRSSRWNPQSLRQSRQPARRRLALGWWHPLSWAQPPRSDRSRSAPSPFRAFAADRVGPLLSPPQRWSAPALSAAARRSLPASWSRARPPGVGWCPGRWWPARPRRSRRWHRSARPGRLTSATGSPVSRGGGGAVVASHHLPDSIAASARGQGRIERCRLAFRTFGVTAPPGGWPAPRSALGCEGWGLALFGAARGRCRIPAPFDSAESRQVRRRAQIVTAADRWTDPGHAARGDRTPLRPSLVGLLPLSPTRQA
jgi:hypothetical protein